MRSLTEDGHAGIDVRSTSNGTETIICVTQTHDVLDEKGAGLASPRPLRKDDMNSRRTAWSTLRRVPRTVLIARHRRNLPDKTSRSLVSLFIELATVSSNDGRKECEVLISGEWPQRAKAMKSKDGHPTSSGKSKCSTSHSAQLKARIEEALSRNVRTVPVRLEVGWCLSVNACARARRIVVSSIPHGQRAVPSPTAASFRSRCAHDFRYRGCFVHTVNVDVPLDSVLVQVAVRCLSFLLCFCGAALVQTPRDCGVVCASLFWKKRIWRQDSDDDATHDEKCKGTRPPRAGTWSLWRLRWENDWATCRPNWLAIQWRAVEVCRVTARSSNMKCWRVEVDFFKRRTLVLCGGTESRSVQIRTLHLNRWSRQSCFQSITLSIEPTRVEERLAVQFVSSLEVRPRWLLDLDLDLGGFGHRVLDWDVSQTAVVGERAQREEKQCASVYAKRRS